MIDQIVPVYPGESFACNAYFVGDGKSFLLIDTSPAAIPIARNIVRGGGRIEAILLTHGHFDHIEGLPIIAKLTNAKIYIGEADKEKLTNDITNRAVYHFAGEFSHYEGEVITLRGGELLHFDCADVEVVAVPGHTAGSLAYLIDDEQFFSGDFIFKRGIGRTDFDDSDPKAMEESLEKFKAMKGEFGIYPGHGAITKFSDEIIFL
jgi:glyoxylase-like metal-dependent hydrolase (beta-lactamase superfamily II)